MAPKTRRVNTRQRFTEERNVSNKVSGSLADRSRCKDCAFFEFKTNPLQVGASEGECHFNPPTMTTLASTNKLTNQMMLQMVASFVPVKPDMWCARFERKESEDESPKERDPSSS